MDCLSLTIVTVFNHAYIIVPESINPYSICKQRSEEGSIKKEGNSIGKQSYFTNICCSLCSDLHVYFCLPLLLSTIGIWYRNMLGFIFKFLEISFCQAQLQLSWKLSQPLFHFFQITAHHLNYPATNPLRIITNHSLVHLTMQGKRYPPMVNVAPVW